MSTLVVSKFGGTSMGNAERMRASAQIALDKKAKIVVVSAMSGVTNKLLELGRAAQTSTWEAAEKIVVEITKMHETAAADLGLTPEQQEPLARLISELESIARGIFLLKDCSAKALDTLQSLGERMSSVLFVPAMQAKAPRGIDVEWLDVRDVLKTDDRFGKAAPLVDLTAAELRKRLPGLRTENKSYVTQGFIGATVDGTTTTLGRGGSDYSAALLAEATGADVLEIWTDVAGIATTDPRLCADAQMISEISFQEASELASFGAKVLHPSTLLPAVRKNIPVFVGSSFEPQKKGTWIRNTASIQPLIRAMALKPKQLLVTLSTPAMMGAPGFLYQIFKVFMDHKISVDAITTSEISVSLTIDESAIDKKCLQDLEAFAEVQTQSSLCLVSLIGNNINHTPGIARKIFDAIPEINVRMICLGASKHNFCFLVEETQGPEVIRRLHKVFVG